MDIIGERKKSRQDWKSIDERGGVRNFDEGGCLNEPKATLANWERGLDPPVVSESALLLVECLPLLLIEANGEAVDWVGGATGSVE